jgi:sulfatase modifying factor 1
MNRLLRRIIELLCAVSLLAQAQFKEIGPPPFPGDVAREQIRTLLETVAPSNMQATVKKLSDLAVWYRDILDEELVAAWRREDRASLTGVVESLASARVASGIVEFSWRERRAETFKPENVQLLENLMIRYWESAKPFLDDLLAATSPGPHALELSETEAEAVCRILLDAPDIGTWENSALQILPHYRASAQKVLNADLFGGNPAKSAQARDWLNALAAAGFPRDAPPGTRQPRDTSSVRSSPPADGSQNRTRVNEKDGQTYVWIPPGAFTMGCSDGDQECDDNEKPAHAESIKAGFWLGQTEVTQAAYQRVIGRNPSFHKGDQLPVETVTWNDAVNYCAAVGGRLPTEVEWEYAARGRSGKTGGRYSDLASAWYSGNSDRTTHPVATKEPNAFGLYDMLGNVWEWVADTYPGSSDKIERGGSYADGPASAGASRREKGAPAVPFYLVGFRCAVGDSPKGPATNQVISRVTPSAMGRERIYTGRDGITQASVISKVDPPYSDVARKLHAEGQVLLQYVITPDGTARQFRVAKSVGYGLDENAIETIRKWAFKPAMKNGSPVSSYETSEINFRLVPKRADLWYSAPIAFNLESGLTPPDVVDGTMPDPDGDRTNESVVLDFTVDSRGSVTDIHPIHGRWDLLTHYLTTWKFRPAMKDNRPVEVTGRIGFIKGQGDDAKVPLTPPSSGTDPNLPDVRESLLTPTVISPLIVQQDVTSSSHAAVDGILRKLTANELYLQTNGRSVLRFRVLGATPFVDQQGNPYRDLLLHPGDHLSVRVDPDDPETANRVVFIRKGSVAERDSADKPVSENSIRAPQPQDLGAVPNPAESSATIPPDAPPIAEFRGPREDTDEVIIAHARAAAASFTQAMPNFEAEQQTIRYSSKSQPSAWKKSDVLTSIVSYSHGKENHRDVKVNGKTPSVPPEQTGAWSNGEFGIFLADMMHPDRKPTFRRRGEELIVGRPALVFDYVVAQANSNFTVAGGERKYKPGYEGAIWIDKNTHFILRIALRATSIPPDFTLNRVEVTVDYRFVQIGSGTYLLPATSENLACETRASVCSRNSTTFRNYRVLTVIPEHDN